MFTDFGASDATSSSKGCRQHNYIPKQVVLWKEGRNNTLDNYSDELWTTETISSGWYTCTFVVLKNQCYIMFYLSLVTCFSHTKSYLCTKVFVYIDNVLFCVSSISLVTPASIECSNFFGWTLILMSNKSSTCALSNFCTMIEPYIHRYLSN